MARDTDQQLSRGQTIGCLVIFVFLLSLIAFGIVRCSGGDSGSGVTDPTARPTKAVQRGLGVSRSELQSVYKPSSMGGFTLRSAPLDNGTPRYIGQSQDGNAALELIGPADNLTGASLMVALNAGRDADVRHGIYLEKLWSKTVSGGNDWLVNSLRRATDVHQQRTTQNGKTIQLLYFDALEAVVLKVERK